MKFRSKVTAAFIGLGIAITALALASCAGLAGTSLTVDQDGNVLVTPPPRPIIIPAK